MIIDPVIPTTWIIAIAIAAIVLTLWSHHVSGRRLSFRSNMALTTVRLIAILLVIALLLQPSREERIVPPTTEKSLVFALDTSASMGEADVGGVQRLDQAREALEESGALTTEANPFRFYLFDESTKLITSDGVRVAGARGNSTRMHTSVRNILRSHSGAPPAGLVILSDGHDFEAVPPSQTARLARSRQCPIYVVPFGAAGSARDVSVRATNFNRFTFPHQQTRITASIRAVGCKHETLTVYLEREGKAVQSKRIELGEQSFHDVDFVVSEEEAGQYEYSIIAKSLPNELATDNNTAVNYLGVLKDRIRILLIEGDPYWDSTFLRRSLARNDKLNVDALVRFTDTRTSVVRSDPELKEIELATPAEPGDYAPYDLIILGQQVDKILGQDGITALEKHIDEGGGAVLFARGRAWDGGSDGLEPIQWSDEGVDAELEVTTGALSIAPFKMLHRRTASEDLPRIVAYQPAGDPKTLAATYGQTEQEQIAIVYRRFGKGQTLSLGLGDLWKWVFNAKSEFDNNLYDLFWDQLVLWLLANGGVTPASGYSFQTNTANLPLGDPIRFTMGLADEAPPEDPPEVVVYHGDNEAARVALNADPDGKSYSAEFTPRTNGRFHAELALPNGSSAQARFMVFREELERTETAADLAYLEQLSKASGGRLLKPAEISDLIDSLLRDSAPMEARSRIIPIWDTPEILLIIAFLFALEWYLRRRWGLT